MLLSISVLSGMMFSFNEPIDTNEIILVLDLSHRTRNSYRDASNDPTTAFERQSINQFVTDTLNQSDGNFRIGIVTFGKNPVLAAAPSTDVVEIDRAFQAHMQRPTLNQRNRDALAADQAVIRHNDNRAQGYRPDDRATNIEAALRFAREQFNDTRGARIVLVTDGFETDGSAESIIIGMAVAGIRIDVVSLTSPVGNEFLIRDIVLPNFIPEVDEVVNIGITVQSSIPVPTPAQLVLHNNGIEVAREIIEVSYGTWPHDISHAFTTTGSQILEATIICLADDEAWFSDGIEYNNTFFSFFFLETFDSILIIYQNNEEMTRLYDMLDISGSFSSVTSVHIDLVPIELRWLRNFDKIILANVGNIDMTNRALSDGLHRDAFVRELHRYVYELGGGLLVLGGDREGYTIVGWEREDPNDENNHNMVPIREWGYVSNVFNRSDTAGRLFQTMLPVTIEDWTAPLAVAIVVDISGSMAANDVFRPDWNRLDLAKVAAETALDALIPRDYVVVIAFDTGARLMTARPFDPTRGMRNVGSELSTIRSAINDLTLGGGTSYMAALQMARDQLLMVDHVAARHILFFTDGQPNHDVSLATDLINEMYNEEGITLSGIGIRGTFDIVRQMADAGRGHSFPVFYQDDVMRLPHDMFMEIARVRANIPESEPFFASVTTNERLEITDDMITNGALPVLLANFYGVRERNLTAEERTNRDFQVILSGPHRVPVYSRWNFGAGRVGALSTNILFEGTLDRPNYFEGNEISLQFLINALRMIAPTEYIGEEQIEIRITEDNFSRHINLFTSLEDSQNDNFVVEIVRLTDPVGTQNPGSMSVLGYDVIERLTMSTVNARFSFTIETPGVYEIRVAQVVPNAPEDLADITDEHIRWRQTRRTIFSYSLEYDVFRCPDEADALLRRIAYLGNGIMINDPRTAAYLSNGMINNRAVDEGIVGGYGIANIFMGFDTHRDAYIDPRLVFIIIAISLFVIDIAVRKFKWKWPWEMVKDRKKKLELAK